MAKHKRTLLMPANFAAVKAGDNVVVQPVKPTESSKPRGDNIPDARKVRRTINLVRRPAAKEIDHAPHVADDQRLCLLNAPGMPPPGPDTQRLAQNLGGEIELKGKGANVQLVNYDYHLSNIVYKMTRSPGDFHFPLTAGPNKVASLKVVTGHKWHSDHVTGPVPADVMVIGKMLGNEESWHCRQFVGPTGEFFREKLDELGVTGYGDWYMTSLMKTVHPGAHSGETTLKRPWLREWLPILYQELRLVRPRYILCLGTDVLKALFGNKATLGSMEGRVETFSYQVGRTAEENIEHTALVMAANAPGAILRAPELEDSFKIALGWFGQLAAGYRPDREEDGLDHRVIRTLGELEALADEIDRDITGNLLYCDAEWHGFHPQNEGAYLRTIQFSWKEKTAACIRLTAPGGQWDFAGSKSELIRVIRRIIRGKRIAGHFFASDLEWLVHFGLPEFREGFEVADNWTDCMAQALDREQPRGGFDTGIAAHSINETDSFGLTQQLLRIGIPRYDYELGQWIKGYCAEHKLKKEELEGFGDAPDALLLPYSLYDSDGGRRLVERQQRLLCRDSHGNNCWEAFWMSMRAQPALFEINTTGLMIDRKKVDELTDLYMGSRAELEQRIRDWARWPELNLNSAFQVRELLFGEALNGKPRDPATNEPVRLRPPGALTLKLTPIMTTDKRPMLWPVVIERELEAEKTPSTNKMALAILAQECQEVVRWHAKQEKYVKYDLSKYVNWIRDYRFISQVLKSVLRPPDLNEAEDGFETDDDGNYEYSGGLPSKICDDDRVRTHIWPTKETGRWSSSNPALQNLSKRREPDYKRVLGSRYKSSLRSIIIASPGHYLVESDFVGAELLGAAIMSGDPTMIDHCLRNQLPEDHPDFYDIHSNIAVPAFRLDCPPTKQGLQDIGKSHLRIAAKACVFGVMYGRAAKALALGVKEEQVNISIDEAQAIIDTIFRTYPGLVPFFGSCQSRATRERWLQNCFGRYRRFPRVLDEKMIGDVERQAMNFPIQSLVADAMNRAVDHLVTYRRQRHLNYRIVLQVHDAVLLEVPAAEVPTTVQDVLPHCLTRSVPIYPTTLDGISNGTGPFHLGTDTEVFKAWGETPLPQCFLADGLDPGLAHWKFDASLGGWKHGKFKGKIWIGDGSGGELQTLAA